MPTARADAAAALRDLTHAFVARDAGDEDLRALADVARTHTASLAHAPARDRLALMRATREAGFPASDSGSGFADRAVGGIDNPASIEFDVNYEGDVVIARLVLRAAFEGAPGRAHGGIVAAAFDEVTGYVIGKLQEPAFTGELTVRYVAPVPVNELLVMRTWLQGRERRKLFIEGDARAGEHVVATCKAIYVTVDPSIFAGAPDPALSPSRAPSASQPGTLAERTQAPYTDTAVRYGCATEGRFARMNYEIVDADCHILEPPDIWKNWLPSKHQDKAPKLVKDPEGGDAWLTAVGGDPDPIGLVATPGMPFDKFRWFGVTYEEARTGCYNGEARLADMDIDGVDAEILFPPQRTMSHFLGDDDDDFVLAGVEAYNNFLFEEFCAADPKRLIGLAQIPSLGIDNAVDSLRKAKSRGAKGVLISNWPSGKAGISRDDDPFWAAAVDEGVPVSVHINIISRAQRSASRKAAAAHGNQLYDMRSEATRAKAIGGMSHVFSMATGAITDMIFTGVFDRFPALQVCWIETGVGWIPHFLECLDDRWWRNRVWGDLPLKEPPSTYWYRNNAASFIVDRTGVELRNRVGVDNMMWSSDYPHHGNDWPYSRKSIEEMMGSLAEHERSRITSGNAARIWHLDD